MEKRTGTKGGWVQKRAQRETAPAATREEVLSEGAGKFRLTWRERREEVLGYKRHGVTTR
jgi:hypothetical protein